VYCDSCGSPLNPSGQFCSSCGKRWAAASGYAAGPAHWRRYSDDRVRRNISTLSTIWLIYGILRMAAALALFSFGHLVFPWVMGRHSWGWEGLVPFGIYTGGAFTAALAGAYLLVAWGLSEREAWARPLAIVMSIFVFLRPPLGTALGIYTLWVLLPDPSRREYEQLAHA
jgi:hypothetical protein